MQLVKRDRCSLKVQLCNKVLSGKYTFLLFCVVFLTSILMYCRCFFGTELTDEAYYIAEAKEILNGNIPYAYNFSSKALGFTFLIIPLQFLYSLFIPTLEGVFLFVRLCFVTLKIVISVILYQLFSKRLKKNQAILIIGALIPLNGFLQNFSYNSIPLWIMLLSVSLLYDAIELHSNGAMVEFFLSGILAAIGVFANFGWGLTLIVFGTIIIVFQEKTKRKKSFILFCCGILLEICIVIIPIIIQAGPQSVAYGFYRLLINPLPVDSLVQKTGFLSTIRDFAKPLMLTVGLLLMVLFFVYVFSRKCVREKVNDLQDNQIILVSVEFALLCTILILGIIQLDNKLSSALGYSFFLSLLILVVFSDSKEKKAAVYFGIYPILYSIAALLLVSNGSPISRFECAYTLLIPILYMLFKEKPALIRQLAYVITGSLILFLCVNSYVYVYRDGPVASLDYKVESGVYKGIYTTKERQKDLVEMELFLNDVIGEDETYSFRDNVPFAYLMTHNGKVCELSTWDYLQYSYKRNTPSPMYDYYRIRNLIPEKIVYIDFGRDENLSIEDDEFKYNDWINAYYDKIDDFVMNQTFKRVIVYKYNGTFDGDYQSWIDSYSEK